MERNCVKLLYTGGWDSTFRLLQLAQFDIDVEPVYIVDKGRASRGKEIETMEKIISICRERFKANIKDITFYDKDEILEKYPNPDVTRAFREMREACGLGVQYEWFALLCRGINEDMEMGIIHRDPSRVKSRIAAEGYYQVIENDFLPERVMAKSKEGMDRIDLVFGHMILPIIEITKEEEGRIAEENGWMDIMKMSWFCHSPINGKPCGLCAPCEDALELGMGWRLPEMAKFRYKHKKFFLFKRRIEHKLFGR